MSFKLLQLFFTFGKILALTPSSTDPEKQSTSKIYSVVVFSVLTLASLASLQSKRFYMHFIHIRTIISYLTDFSFFGFHFCVIVVVSFWKREQWSELLDNLRVVENLTGVRKSCESRFTRYGGVVAAHAVYFTVTFYAVGFWYRISNTLYFQQHAVRQIEHYIQFFYKYVLAILLKMILEKYQEVNVLLTTLLQYRQKLRTDFFSVYDPLLFNLKKTEYALCLLKRTVNIFNDLFGWPIFFIILHTTFQILNHVSYAIFNTTGFHLLVVVAASLSLTLVMTVIVIFMCDRVVQEAEKIVPLTYQLRWCYKSGTREEKQELYEFSNFVTENLPSFSAANFFLLQKSTVLSILSTVSTVIIIMIQFAGK
ncbi:uncharacterized protein [Tenebrio molitor]|uniref:uncharacterized protein n=1 Tax=Tenebrio molitor TaxID=7067 RepID=UPI003624A497